MDAAPINVGVIGLGFMGATHVAAYQAAAAAGLPCRLAAVCDSRPERRAGRLGGVRDNLATGADAAAFDFKQVRGYARPEELIADKDVQLVSICTHTPTHVDLAEKAMRAGKHVLLEKPVALTAAPVRRLAEVAEQTGMICMPAMCMRFWPTWVWLKEAVEEKRFGAVRSARFTRLGVRPGWSDFYADPAASGGALVDLHVHDTDFVVYLFGPPGRVATSGYADHVTTLYEYERIPHVVAEGGWDQQAGFAFTMRYLVNFEQTTLDFDIARDPQLMLCRDGAAEPVTVDPGAGYEPEIRHLVECLAAGRRPAVDLRHAAVTHAVLDAERKSLETGAAVSL